MSYVHISYHQTFFYNLFSRHVATLCSGNLRNISPIFILILFLISFFISTRSLYLSILMLHVTTDLWETCAHTCCSEDIFKISNILLMMGFKKKNQFPRLQVYQVFSIQEVIFLYEIRIESYINKENYNCYWNS